MGKQKYPLATSEGGTTPHGTTSAKKYTNINVTITSVTKMNGNNIYPHVNPIRYDTKQVV